MKRSQNIITMHYLSYEHHLNCNNLKLVSFENKVVLLTEVLKSIVQWVNKSDHIDESAVRSMVNNHVDEIFNKFKKKEQPTNKKEEEND